MSRWSHCSCSQAGFWDHHQVRIRRGRVSAWLACVLFKNKIEGSSKCLGQGWVFLKQLKRWNPFTHTHTHTNTHPGAKSWPCCRTKDHVWACRIFEDQTKMGRMERPKLQAALAAWQILNRYLLQKWSVLLVWHVFIRMFDLPLLLCACWPAPCLLRPTGRKQRPFQNLRGPPTNPPRPLWRASQPEVHINHYCSMSWLRTKPLHYTMWEVCCAWAPSRPFRWCWAAVTIRRFPTFAVCPPKHNAAKTMQCRSHGTGSPAPKQSKGASQFIFKIEKKGGENKIKKHHTTKANFPHIKLSKKHYIPHNAFNYQ